MANIPKKQKHRAYLPKVIRKPGNNQKFYSSPAWQKKRKSYRLKVGLICECHKFFGKDFTEPRMPVDHIIPLEYGGAKFDERNLNLLAISLHEKKSNLEGKKGGPLVAAKKNKNGYLVPVNKKDIWQILWKK